MNVAFVGPGLMGRGMIANLAAAGHDLTVYARTPSRAEGLPAQVVSSIVEAVEGRDAVCLCVTDSEDVRSVVREILTAEHPPPVIIDHSTIAPAVAREVAADCAERGVAFLDCPVSGGPPGAAAGTLAIMCGGDAAALERVAPLLDAVGDPARRTHCGPVGAGLVVKLINNLLVGVISAGTAEALSIGQEAGIDPALVREVLLGASAASWQLEHLSPRVLAGDHTPGFTATNLRKDLGHARALTDRELPIADAAAASFADVPDDRDYGAVARKYMTLPG